MGKASRAKKERGTSGGPEGQRPPAPPSERAPGPAADAAAQEVAGPTPPWQVPRSLALILVASALFRAVYFYLYSKSSIFFDGLILDSEVYDRWARAIASGEWIGKEVFYFPPLYPYALGVGFRLLGHSFTSVYLGQALLGLVNLVLIYRIGAAVFGASAGVIAAAGAALYGPFAFFEMKLLSTTLGLTLNLVALLAMVTAEQASDRRGGGPAWRWLLCGLAIGLAAVCLPATILLALLYAGVRALRDPRSAALLAAGAFAALLPVLAHNLYVAGDPLFLSAQGGITFYQGNNPRAHGLYNVVPGFSGAPELQAQEEKTIAERETGRTLRRSEVSTHFFAKGLAFIFGSPGAWLALELQKLGALLGSYEASTEYSIYLEREQLPWLRIACLPFAAIAGLGIVSLLGGGARGALAGLRGGPRTAPRERAGGALLLYTLYAASVPLLFYVSSRYRLPLVPALLIYAGALLDRVVAGVRAHGQVPAAEGRGLAIAFAAACISFFPLGQPSVTAEANVYYNIGNLLADKGLHEEAVRSFDRSLVDFPTNAFALINRGNSLDKLGRPEEALASYHQAEEVKHDFWKAYQLQGAVLRRLGRQEEEADVYRRGLAAGGAQAHFLLATTLQALRRMDEAVGELKEAIRLKPNDARFHNALGEIFEGQRHLDAAINAYRQANAADPRFAPSRFNLALLYRELGQPKDAEPVLQEALRLEPRNARGHARLGDIYAMSGEAEKARLEYRVALSIDPQETLAKAGLARLGK